MRPSDISSEALAASKVATSPSITSASPDISLESSRRLQMSSVGVPWAAASCGGASVSRGATLGASAWTRSDPSASGRARRSGDRDVGEAGDAVTGDASGAGTAIVVPSDMACVAKDASGTGTGAVVASERPRLPSDEGSAPESCRAASDAALASGAGDSAGAAEEAGVTSRAGRGGGGGGLPVCMRRGVSELLGAACAGSGLGSSRFTLRRGGGAPGPNRSCPSSKLFTERKSMWSGSASAFASGAWPWCLISSRMCSSAWRLPKGSAE
mmetsp:Transcript_27063/g.69538  ORF Transcript_27063/g.69538 Transcript_27063/m.69538 type:complete len:270 (-) Transcript_27063:1883-2692(-)